MLKFKEGKLPKTPQAKLKYLYRLQELLRLYHNKKGEDVKKKKISLEEFRKFQQGWFKNRNSLICGKILECKNSLTESQKESLLEYDEEAKAYGAVKDKDKFKKDKKVQINIDDIEEG